MPALPNVPGVLRVAVIGSANDDTDVVSRFFLAYSGTAPNIPDLDAFALGVGNLWATNILPMQTPAYVLTEVEVTDLSGPTAARGSNSSSSPGTRSGSGFTAATAVVVDFKIARRYRGGHPRVSIFAGVSTDLVSVQRWSPTFLTDFSNAWNAFMSGVLELTWTGATIVDQVNVSYYAGYHLVTFPSGRSRDVPTLREVPIIDGILGFGVNAHVGSQRRRNEMT